MKIKQITVVLLTSLHCCLSFLCRVTVPYTLLRRNIGSFIFMLNHIIVYDYYREQNNSITWHLSLTYLYINHVSNSNYIIVEGSYMIYNLGDGFENLSLILLPGIFRVRQS